MSAWWSIDHSVPYWSQYRLTVIELGDYRDSLENAPSMDLTINLLYLYATQGRQPSLKQAVAEDDGQWSISIVMAAQETYRVKHA